MKNRDQLIARMEAIIAAGEGRGLTADEQTEFNSLTAQVDTIDRRAEVQARRVAAPNSDQRQVPMRVPHQANSLTLAPGESLAARFAPPAEGALDLGDCVRAQLGIGSKPGILAAQNIGDGQRGGFLAPAYMSARVIDLARAKARTAQAGVPMIPVSGPTDFAKLESDPVFSQHLENESLTEREILFGLHSSKPYTSAFLGRMSVEAVEDAPNLGSVLEEAIAAAFAVDIDSVILNGNGIGKTTGILNESGITEIDGTGLDDWSLLARAYQAVRQQNFEPGAFITSPGVVGKLDSLVDTTGQPLARPPSLQNTAFLDTTSITDAASPTGSVAVTGDWSKYFLCMRTDITIEATRTGGDAFSKMSVLVRAYARFDGFAIRPKAFAKVTGIPTPAV